MLLTYFPIIRSVNDRRLIDLSFGLSLNYRSLTPSPEICQISGKWNIWKQRKTQDTEIFVLTCAKTTQDKTPFNSTSVAVYSPDENSTFTGHIHDTNKFPPLNRVSGEENRHHGVHLNAIPSTASASDIHHPKSFRFLIHIFTQAARTIYTWVSRVDVVLVGMIRST